MEASPYMATRRRRSRPRPCPCVSSSLHTTAAVSCIASVLPLLLLLLFLLLPTTSAFSSGTNPPPPPPPLIDRVPTFRLYQHGHCQAQVSGRGEVGECSSRLHEAITALAPSKKGKPKHQPAQEEQEEEQKKAGASAGAVAPILNIPSLAALELLLHQQQQQQSSSSSPATPTTNQDEEVLLVEFYGQACKQCIALNPLFESLPFVYRDRRLRFGRADVTHFPTLVIPPPAPTAFVGLDRSQDIEARLDGCPRCGGGGFVPCAECAGKGHIVRSVNGHSVADVCMACVGHRKVPCPQCGGKCYLC